MTDDDDDLTWSPSADAEIREKIRQKLAELVAGPLEEFDVGLVSLVNTATAAAADAAALLEWRHRVHRDGIPADDDGQTEVADAADSLGDLLRWVAWGIADDIQEIDPERN